MAPKSKKPIERVGILALKTPRRRVSRLPGFARPELQLQPQQQQQAAPVVSTKPRPTKRARDGDSHDSNARELFPPEPSSKRDATTDATKAKKWKIPKKAKQAAAPHDDGAPPPAEPRAVAPAPTSDAFMMDAEDIAELTDELSVRASATAATAKDAAADFDVTGSDGIFDDAFDEPEPTPEQECATRERANARATDRPMNTARVRAVCPSDASDRATRASERSSDACTHTCVRMRTRVHRPDDGDLSFDQPTDPAGVAPPRAVPPYVPTMSAPAPSYGEDVFGFGDDFVDVGESAAIAAHDASAVASTGAQEEHELELGSLFEPPEDDPDAEIAATSVAAPPAAQTARFTSSDETDAMSASRITDEIVAILPEEWMPLLLSYGGETSLSNEKRLARVRKRLLQQTPGKLSTMRRALKHYVAYLADNGLAMDTFSTDALIDAIEVYDEDAQERAQSRATKRKAKGEKPRANDRGGKTAAMPIFHGWRSLRKLAGLPFELTDDVKECARAGPGMPRVARMLNLRHVRSLERTMRDETESQFVRAYAAGRWLCVAATTRTIDMQRTPSIHFETTRALARDIVVVCGISKRSKAPSALEMRPLAWRAPLIAIDGGEVCLEPLLEAMTTFEGNSCVFLDFIVPPGEPKSIYKATAWAPRAAPHGTIVGAVREILDDEDLGGHDERHVIPEIARGLKLPRHVREAVGHWRPQPHVADSRDDRAAVARATALARERRNRAGALASCADRYSSVGAAPVEQDSTRAMCLLAARDLLCSDEVPESASEQIAEIASRNDTDGPEAARRLKAAKAQNGNPEAAAGAAVLVSLGGSE